MNEIFRILGAPSRIFRAYLFVFWIAVMFFFWTFTPIQGMPYPSEVWEAFQRMFASNEWTNNLIYNTWVTLKLNIVGLFYATIISLYSCLFQLFAIVATFQSNFAMVSIFADCGI